MIGFRTLCLLALGLAMNSAYAQDSQPAAKDTSSTGSSPSQPAATEKNQPAAQPTGTSPAGTAAGSTSAATSTDQAYDLKLRGLEERVNELKEKIFRTKARILQLQETVVSESIGVGARSVLVHRNEMGGSFKLLSVVYTLDTQPIFKKVDVDGDLDGMPEKEIFNANIVPGNHNISVKMVFQGQGFGFFSYVKGYKFTVTSSYTFTAEEGKIITVKIVGFEKSGITLKLEDRPAIRYDIQIEKLTPDRAKTLQQKAEDSG
jgi:hypothetical protein